MKNEQILNLFENIENAFQNSKHKYLPSKVSFFIQKNRKVLQENVITIEKVRMDIIQNYGKISEDQNRYNFDPEVIETVNKELDDLRNIEQDIQFSKIKLSDLEGIEFTLDQMEALMFMIEED